MLDHPASDKAPFGQAVRARSALGGGWLGWVVAVDDITKVEVRLGRDSVQGNRHRPDGVELRWRQVGVRGHAVRPAAAVLHRSGSPPPSSTPARAAPAPCGWRPSRSPATRTGSATGSATPSRARSRTSPSSGSPPHGTPGHRRRAVRHPERRRPHLACTDDVDAARRRGPEPEHLAPHRDLRAREPLGRPRPGDRVRDARGARSGGLVRARRARPRLRHRLPPAPLGGRGALGRRRGAAPRPGGGGGPAYLPARQRPVLLGTAQRIPLPPASVDVGAGPVGVLLRTGLRAGPAGARPGGAPGRHGVRGRQRHLPAARSGRGSGAATRWSTPTRWSGSGPATAGSGVRSTSCGGSRPAPSSRPACASSSTLTSPPRCSPSTRAPSVDYAVNLWWRTY